MSEVKVNKISPRTNCGTVTLGDSGDTFSIPAGVTLTNSGTATGFGPTGAVSWNTTAITSSPLTAASGVGYFIDTSGGAITVNLPAGSAGAIISLADYTNTWQTNAVTVNANGSEKIGGVAASATLDTEGQSVTFIYVDATEGWKNIQDSTSNVTGNPFIVATGGTITTCGNCKIHTFTGPGTFTVCAVAVCSSNNIVSYVVVAGGGAAGHCTSGGGGAGGFREVANPITPYTASPLNGYCTPANRVTITATAYPIVVGAGGAGNTAPSNPAPTQNGSSSSFGGIISAGGGGSKNADNAVGGSGGSGGGGGFVFPGSLVPSPDAFKGIGNTPPVSPSQGNPGGVGYNAYSPFSPASLMTGGGGGAGAAGQNGGPSGAGGIISGGGGNGVSSSITGSSVARAGGGAGGVKGGGSVSPAGTGGGGGTGTVPTAGTSGAVNTGGGAGGQSDSLSVSGSGGSGIVVIRYKFQ
jgi:hypothetical protein